MLAPVLEKEERWVSGAYWLTIPAYLVISRPVRDPISIYQSIRWTVL